MKPFVSVIFSSHNGQGTLPKALEALQKVRAPVGGWQIIAVDNASTDATSTLLQQAQGALPLRALSEGRRGKNVALNAALAHAEGELIVFTDDDVQPEPDWLVQLQGAAERHPNAALFGGTIRPRWPKPAPDWILKHVPLGLTYGITATDLSEGDVFPGLIWGANMMVRRAVFDSGLRFNEAVGPSAGQYIMGSETEFNFRAAADGWKSAFVPQAVVHHMIRDAQMERAWVLNRAYRFGRNMWNQECITPTQHISPTVFGLPRWRFRKYLDHNVALLWTRLLGDQEASFPHEWELYFLRGYLSQWWKTRGAVTSSA